MDELIEEIEAASTGADIRTPLVRTLTYLFEHGREATKLAETLPRGEGFKDYTYFAMQNNTVEIDPETGREYIRIGISTLLPFDTWSSRPSIESPKLVANGTICLALGTDNARLKRDLIEPLEALLHG